MRIRRYRGKHLQARPKRGAPVVVAAAAAVSVPGSAAAHVGTHVVKRGETLSGIAQRYGTSAAKLAAVNGVTNPDHILAGQRLQVDAPTSTTVAIHRGETLSSLAARYGTSVTALARANNLSNPSLIIAGDELRVPAAAPQATPPAAAAAPVSSDVGSAIDSQATAHGVDPALAKAVAWQESAWRQEAVSSASARGVMQVMPDTARYVNESLGGGQLDVRDTGDNVHLGVMYLRHMLDTMPSERKALAAYYSGPGAVNGALDAGQRNYVRNVRAHERRFR